MVTALVLFSSLVVGGDRETLRSRGPFWGVGTSRSGCGWVVVLFWSPGVVVLLVVVVLSCWMV